MVTYNFMSFAIVFQSYQDQGRECDLFWLFCKCIWTGQVRKLFITSLILDECSCNEVHRPCLCKQQTNIEVFCVNTLQFLHNREQRHSVFEY